MLEDEFTFFKANHDSLFEKYPNKYIVIKDKAIQNSSNTFEEALDFASSKFELGTFLIQFCSAGNEGYTQTFHSRVIFA